LLNPAAGELKLTGKINLLLRKEFLSGDHFILSLAVEVFSHKYI